MNRRVIILSAVAVLLLAGGWTVKFLFFQSPEQQLLRMQAKLLRAVEKRDWDTIRALLDEKYNDGNGTTPDQVLENGRQALGGFFTLTLQAETTWVKGTHDMGFVKQRIKIEGNGTAVAQMVMSKVNSTKEPWVFHWRNPGRWPWQWRLNQVQNDYVL